MSDLIKELRGACSLPTGLYGEAADEIERLQSQITAMTKDMESMKPWRELQEELAALKRENEELRDELAALKAQSTEQPVAWNIYIKNPEYPMATKPTGTLYDYESVKQTVERVHDAVVEPLFATPPTAIALVEDFKRRAVEVCAALNAGYSIPFEAVTQCAELIESLPLIEGEK